MNGGQGSSAKTRLPGRMQKSVKHVLVFCVVVVVRLLTLPYYRFFHFNTLAVFRRLAECATDPSNITRMTWMLINWRERKLQELQFVSVACIALAGAVIGSFSWSFIANAVWPTFAFWYGSLVLSVLGILLAAQQIAAISCLGRIPQTSESMEAAAAAVEKYMKLMMVVQKDANRVASTILSDGRGGTTCRYSWRMVFVWQSPIMFMSYSVCFYLMGLLLLVISPLTRLKSTGWNNDADIAMFFLAICGVSGLVFVLCAFWIYQNIDENMDSA